jgi:hypothetical protein
MLDADICIAPNALQGFAFELPMPYFIRLGYS